MAKTFLDRSAPPAAGSARGGRIAVAAPTQPPARSITRTTPAGSGAYFAVKRAFDVVVASVLLAVSAPIILLIAVAIRLDSRGPAIFRQERVRGRRVSRDTWQLEPFTIFKFRSMVAHAESALHQDYITAYIKGDHARLGALRPERKEGESFRPRHDPRVTRIGAFLRRTSLDELPQLWNVLRGDMSLVGPRPPVPYEVALYRDHELLRLTTPGGITGWAQIKGRCSIGFPELIRLDLEYLRCQGLWFDLRVLLMTLPVVLSTEGAD